MSTAIQFAGFVLAAFISKLLSSLDDMAWLPVFFTTNYSFKRRILHTVQYLLVMCVVVVFAYLVSLGGTTLFEKYLPQEGYWNAKVVLGTFSGLLLLAFAAYIFYKDLKEARVEAAQAGSSLGRTVSEVTPITPLDGVAAEAKDESTSPVPELVAAKPQHIFRLIIVATLGSLDDWVVFTSLLLGGIFKVWHLLIGVFLGSVVVVALSVFIGMFDRLTAMLKKIPLWGILFILSVFTLTSAHVTL